MHSPNGNSLANECLVRILEGFIYVPNESSELDLSLPRSRFARSLLVLLAVTNYGAQRSSVARLTGNHVFKLINNIDPEHCLFQPYDWRTTVT